MILNFLSVLAWFPVFLIRIILIILGLVIVPFDRKGTFPIWGNREYPQPPSWFMKGKLISFAVSSGMRCAIPQITFAT